MTDYEDYYGKKVSLEQLIHDLANELGYEIDLVHHEQDYHHRAYTEYQGWKKKEISE